MPTAPIPSELREYLKRATRRPLPVNWAYADASAGAVSARGPGGWVAIEGVPGSERELRVVARGAKDDTAVVSEPGAAVERFYAWVAHFARVPAITNEEALALVRHELQRLPGPDRTVQGFTPHQDNTITVRVDGPVPYQARATGLFGRLGRRPRGEGTTWFRVGRTHRDAFLVSHGGSYQRQGELVPVPHPGERLNPPGARDGWVYYLDATDDDGEPIEHFEEIALGAERTEERRAIASLPASSRRGAHAYRLTASWDGWPAGTLVLLPQDGNDAYVHGLGRPRVAVTNASGRLNPRSGRDGWTHYLDASDDDGEGIEHFEEIAPGTERPDERRAIASLPARARRGTQAFRLTAPWDGWPSGALVLVPEDGEGAYLHALGRARGARTNPCACSQRPIEGARVNPQVHAGADPRGWFPNPRVSVGDRLTPADYPGVFADFSERGVPVVDDPWPARPCPTDEPCPDTVEEVRLSDEIRALLATREEFEGVREELVRRLDALPYGGPHKVKSRTKTPFSIINKLRRKRLTGPHGLTDIAGAMAIVADGPAMHAVVHAIASGRIGRVLEHEDFYAHPNDGYRAHHFVVDVAGRPVEVQVKTVRQANIAGAMHTAYKTGALNAAEAERVGRLAERADDGDRAAAAEVDALLVDSPALERALTRGATRANHHIAPGARKRHARLGLVEVLLALPGDEYDVRQVGGARERATVAGHSLR